MPSRPFILLILLFWAATTGWLFHREVWPYLRTGDPPPYTIDLADEARRVELKVRWQLRRGDRPIGEAQSWVKYHDEDDTFELHSTLLRVELAALGPFTIEVERLESIYRVNRKGELRGLSVDASLALQTPGLGKLGLSRRTELEAKVHVEGDVVEDGFRPHGTLTVGGHTEPIPLEPVPVPGHGSVLNPLHAINRITGLRRGQHWQMPLVDPLADSVMAMLRKTPAGQVLLDQAPRVQVLQAEVAPDTELLTWDKREVPCLVIDYRGDKVRARTWVRESDGAVLRQEANVWGDKLIQERQP